MHPEGRASKRVFGWHALRGAFARLNESRWCRYALNHRLIASTPSGALSSVRSVSLKNCLLRSGQPVRSASQPGQQLAPTDSEGVTAISRRLSAATPTDRVLAEYAPRRACQQAGVWLAHPSGCVCASQRVPVVSLCAQPPANRFDPFGGVAFGSFREERSHLRNAYHYTARAIEHAEPNKVHLN